MGDAPHRDSTRGPASPSTVKADSTRMCVGCRVRCEGVHLLRVVMVNGTLVPDPHRRLPGRGAWVHPSRVCMEAAHTRRAWKRALRLGADPDADNVWRYLGIDPDTKALPHDAAAVEHQETRSTHREHAVKLER